MDFRRVLSGLLVVGSLFLSSFCCGMRCADPKVNNCCASEQGDVVNGKDRYRAWIVSSKMVKVVFFSMAGVMLATVVVDLVSRVLHVVELFKDIKRK